jgi:hypothetical protein
VYFNIWYISSLYNFLSWDILSYSCYQFFFMYFKIYIVPENLLLIFLLRSCYIHWHTKDT